MKKTFLLFSLSLLAVFAQAQVHVGPTQTYKTIYLASKAKAIKPGDTVYVHAGIYTDAGQIIDSLIGTPTKWITIRPFQNDSVSIQVQYTFQHAQYLKITGLNFYGNNSAQSTNVYHLLYFDYGYDCFNAIHDIIIDNCKFTDLNNAGKQNTGACLKLTGVDKFQVTNCLFRNAVNTADALSFNSDRNGLVQNCRFENQPLFGSHCKGGSKNITYQKNVFLNCMDTGIDVGGSTGTSFFCPAYNANTSWEADSIKVYSNVFIGGKTGIRLSACWNSEVYNNTCFKTTQFAFRTLNASGNPIYLKNNHVYNNIFTVYAGFIYMNASAGYNYNTHYFRNNLFHNYLAANPTSINWSEYPGVNVSGTLIGNPLFKDTLKKDFTLLSGSPAIGAGFATTQPVTDFNGNNYNTNRSIGAFEFTGQQAIADMEDANDVSIFPNPSPGLFTVTFTGAGSISSVEVYNTTGQLVYSGKPSTYLLQINLQGMAKGMYKVLLRSNKGSLTAKTVVVE